MTNVAIEKKASFIKTFIDKLGDVVNWEHKGEVIDSGVKSKEKCVCGHSIRYCFILENNGKKAQVGSECINHFKDYNISLYNSLIASIERIKNEEKEMKEMLLKKEVTVLIEEYENKFFKIAGWYKENYPGWCNEYGIWYFVSHLYRKPIKNYKRIGSVVSWYKKSLESVNNFMKEYNI